MQARAFLNLQYWVLLLRSRSDTGSSRSRPIRVPALTRTELLAGDSSNVGPIPLRGRVTSILYLLA